MICIFHSTLRHTKHLQLSALSICVGPRNKSLKFQISNVTDEQKKVALHKCLMKPGWSVIPDYLEAIDRRMLTDGGVRVYLLRDLFQVFVV